MLRGALAAALTPLRDDGAALDDDAFGPYCDFLVAGGLDGLLAFGTNGEGVLFSVEERMRGLRLFIDASRERLQVAAHCGAQTTADTVALAADANADSVVDTIDIIATDAAEAGADAVAVIGPPYFPLDTHAQLVHFSAAADACAPLPFYVYEFARTSGYAVSLDTLARLRDDAPNFVGMKVSDTPWEAFEPYLLDGLAVFVGPEALIHLGIQAGAVGAVSALAGAFPAEVAAVVRDPTEPGAATLAELRAGVERFPRQAALKRVVASRGVPLRSDVRAPLRDLIEVEAAELDSWLASTTAAAA